MLNNLSAALREVRRFEEAIGAYAQAVGFYREIDDRHGEGQALGNLGVALREVRRFEEAIDVHSRAAVIFRETGDRHREGMVLNNLGLALGEVGRRGDGSAVLEQAVGIYRGLAAGCESGLELALARMLLGLARLRVDVEGERILPGALMAAQEAVELFDRLAPGSGSAAGARCGSCRSRRGSRSSAGTGMPAAAAAATTRRQPGAARCNVGARSPDRPAGSASAGVGGEGVPDGIEQPRADDAAALPDARHLARG